VRQPAFPCRAFLHGLLQIAQACGASSPHLYKVLRVLAQHEMLDELSGKRFTPNDATRELVQVGEELAVHD
jgi:hypothetical protein